MQDPIQAGKAPIPWRRAQRTGRRLLRSTHANNGSAWPVWTPNGGAIVYQEAGTTGRGQLELIDTLGTRYGSAGEPRNAEVDAAIARGDDTIDLTYEVPDHVVEAADSLAALMAEADEFCEREQMLTLQRSDVVREFSDWYLDEFRRQINGEPPQPWNGPLDP